jgi:hypothetical protein
MGDSVLGSLVLNLFSSGSGSTTSNLLSAIYAQPGSGGSSGVNPVVALQNAEQNSTQDIAAEAAQPAVAQAIATFKSAVTSATSVQQLLSNPTVLTVLLTANGLGDQAQYPALAKQALLSDPNNSSSLANQLASSNSNWQTTVQTYDFANQGLSVIQNPSVISTIANGYAEVLWRQSLDKSTPGLSEALDFKQRASSIKSADDVLGDPTFRTVVTTALSIPEQIAFQPIQAQEQAITSKVNIANFQNPSFVASMTTQYLIMAQQQASSSSSGGSESLAQLAVSASSLVV